ncbi:hypothetical protein TWF694_002041 [Orbilia ellipsospora]|uniref:Uncharacterized protein n=1 Tax=Orbilia ellipsospora TaxID=2528407 RepID=A0AAV9X5J0_9PEZI
MIRADEDIWSKFFQTHLFSALSQSQSTLTRLKMTFDRTYDPAYSPECNRINDYSCAALRLPHLQQFEYCCHKPEGYHAIFSILHGCQNTLKELSCEDSWRLYASRVDIPVPNPLASHYENWRNCEICCQNRPDGGANGKSIRLQKLSKWKLEGYDEKQKYRGVGRFLALPQEYPLIQIFSDNHILQNAPIETLNVDRILQIHSRFSTMDLVHILQCLSTWKARELEFVRLLRSRTGVESIKVYRNRVTGPYWMESLMGHWQALRELDMSYEFTINEAELERIGKSLPKLKKLIVDLVLEEIHVPASILDGRVFPELQFFNNTSVLDPPLALTDMEEALCKTIKKSMDLGIWSGTLNAILLGMDETDFCFAFFLERTSYEWAWNFGPRSSHVLARELAQAGLRLRYLLPSSSRSIAAANKFARDPRNHDTPDAEEFLRRKRKFMFE